MAQITGLIAGPNKNYDYQLTSLSRVILNSGIVSASDLAVTTNSVAAGEGFILCTRTNGQKIMVDYNNTSAVTIDTTGTKKVWVGISQAVVDDGSGNALDGTGIATIQTGASYPSANYIPLATIVSGVITDDRQLITGKPITRSGFPTSKTVYVDPSTGNEVVKDTALGSSIADTEWIISRDPITGNEKRVPFGQMKNLLSNSGKFIQTVPLCEDISGTSPIPIAVVSSQTAQGVNSQIPTLTSNTSAPGITVSCSISGQVSSSAYLAFDGNNGTGLYSGNYYNPASVTVDFGKTVYATAFDVNYTDNNGAQMAVQGSPDNSSWTTLISPINPGNNTNLRYRGPGYRYYRVFTHINTGQIFQFNTFQVYYRDTYCSGVYFNNVLGSNISGNRVKSGIRFQVPFNTTLGLVKVSQLSTSASAKIQLLDDTGTLITEVAVSIGSDTGVFSSASLNKDTIYRLVMNDTANFGNNSNELALASYQTGFRYAISGTLNGGNSVLPQNIIGVQIGTLCGVKASASLTSEYAIFAGFITGTKIRGDVVDLNANDGVLVSGFSGLTPQTKYYLSNTDGQIASSAGTISRQVGMAMSATELYIASTYYPGTSITRP